MAKNKLFQVWATVTNKDLWLALILEFDTKKISSYILKTKDWIPWCYL